MIYLDRPKQTRHRINGSPTERFWGHTTEQDDGCWLWQSTVNSHGYGVLRVGPRLVRAHRFAYELLVGPIPDGLELDHLCRVRNCVNPAHLEPVTHSENLRRGGSPSAIHAAKTHCKNGHELLPENIYIRTKPFARVCRVCHAERRRR